VASVRRFAIAQYWLELDKTDHLAMLRPNITDRSRPRFDTFGGAVKLYDQIRLEDPAGKLADDATMAAAGAYFGEEIYNRADHFYADLRKNFPSSKHQFDAHLLGMKCKIKLYQGADYNGEPLEQAETLIKRMYLQFPDRAQQEHEALQTALKGIRAKKAERLWRFAEYYAFRKEYAGARYYYQEIVKQFPQSNLSEKARKELLALGDEPDRSPDRMTWLSDAFPKPQRKRGALLSGTFIDEIFR